jgi:hypothetical protein
MKYWRKSIETKFCHLPSREFFQSVPACTGAWLKVLHKSPDGTWHVSTSIWVGNKSVGVEGLRSTWGWCISDLFVVLGKGLFVVQTG